MRISYKLQTTKFSYERTKHIAYNTKHPPNPPPLNWNINMHSNQQNNKTSASSTLNCFMNAFQDREKINWQCRPRNIPTCFENYLTTDDFGSRSTISRSYNYPSTSSSSSPMFKNNSSIMWLDLPCELKEKSLYFVSLTSKLLKYLLTLQQNDLKSINSNPFPCNYSSIENVTTNIINNLI